MTEYPCEFGFRFYDERKILKLYEEEFFFDNTNLNNNLETSIKRWQSYRGLTYPLEIVFGKELPFYQD